MTIFKATIKRFYPRVVKTQAIKEDVVKANLSNMANQVQLLTRNSLLETVFDKKKTYLWMHLF